MFNLPDGSWQSEFKPTPLGAGASAGPAGTAIGSSTPTGSAKPASTPTSGDQQSQTDSAGTPNESGGGAAAGAASGTVTDSPVTASGASGTSTPSASPSGSDAAESSGMGLPAQLGLIFGILAAVSIGLALFCWRYRRRRRHERIARAIYGANGGIPPARPYGQREKGGEGLMEEARLNDLGDSGNEKPTAPLPPPPTPPSKDVGLGLGAISAGFATLRQYVRRQPVESYAVLHDEGPSGAAPAGIPSRKSTRKVGNGIRLIGPRTQTHEPYNAPQRAMSTTTRDSRRDMLSDEDSRNFPPGAEDWEVGDISRGRWKPARSILAHHAEEEDPFDDHDDAESLHPPMRGGPVPTPHESRSNLDPFDDRQGDFGLPQVHSDPLLDLDTLLPPPVSSSNKRFSHLSMASGPSTTVSDREEGIVQHAQYASVITAASSPALSESAYQPVKRTDTFFRRMAAGGIASLLPTTRSSSSAGAGFVAQRASLFDIHIRDPAPPPSLWPVVSRDILSAPTPAPMPTQIPPPVLPSKPPTAWKAKAGHDLTLDLQNPPQRPTHHPGPSLTSITSARSMRDMVIVQREPTSSSGESVIIEHTHCAQASTDTGSGSSSGSRSDDQLDEMVQHDTPLTQPPTHTPLISETPGSVVFDGAAFALSPTETDQGSEGTPTAAVKTSPAVPLPTRSLPAPAPAPSPMATPTKSQSRAPSGSPIPHPLLSHRRPVSEMVKSINKRGGGGGTSHNASPVSSLFSPASQYSPASSSPTSSPAAGRKRPTTLYEAVKRDKLLVTNPDGRRP